MATPHARYRSPSLHDDSRLDWSPPSRKPNPFLNKHVLVIAAGVFCALLLLIVILNIKIGPISTIAENQNPSTPKPEELIPSKLDKTDPTAHPFDYAHGTIDAPQGAWISITNPKTGRLVQQYRFDHIDPNPPGKGPEWMAMQNPQVKLFMESNRVVVLTGKSSLAHAPQRALVSGSITGDVTINVYEPQNGSLPDTSTAPSSLTVNTDQASFDNFLGEVRCDGPVLINHPRAEIPAHNLRLLINDTNNTLTLHMDGADYIRLHPAERTEVAQASPPDSAPSIPAPDQSNTSPHNSSALLASTDTKPNSSSTAAPAHQTHSSNSSADPSATRPSTPSPSPASFHSAKNPKSAADAPTFYHLILHDNVRIVQGDSQSGKILTGDTLSVVFSSKTKSLEDTTLSSRDLSFPSPLRAFPLSPAVAPLSAIAAFSFAQTSRLAPDSSAISAPKPGETLITFTGPVSLEPLQDSSLKPPTPEDALFDLTGAPVTVHDLTADTNITCASARYTTADQRIDLLAGPDHAVRMTTKDYLAEGQHAWLAQATGLAGFVDAGWMGVLDHNSPASQPEAHSPAASQPANPLVQLKISWTKGVDLEMDPAASNSQTRRLRKATFTGDVHVDSPDLDLTSEIMHVGFRGGSAAPANGSATAPAAEPNSIESIIAEGGTDGKGVAADQRTQMLFADYLHVTLLPAKPKTSSTSADAATQPAATMPADSSTKNISTTSLQDKAAQVQVNTLAAKGDVQILLADGTRVFSDNLFADAPKRTVSLKGSDILIVKDTMVIQKGTDIEIDDMAGLSHMQGPGQGLLLNQTVPVLDRQRIPKPVLNEDLNPAQARIRWNDGADFDHHADDGAGALTVRGSVDAESHPSDLEKNTMTGDALTIHFQHNTAATQPASAPALAAASSPVKKGGDPFQSSLTANSGPRVVARFVATGNARLQNTVRQNSQDETPRIFYIAGNSVDYNAITREALIDGAGEFLIRDLHSPEQMTASAREKNTALPDAPFSSRGTSQFNWKKRLQLVRTNSESWTLTMQGDVQGKHLTPDQKISTITGQNVGADLVSVEPAASAPATIPATAPASSSRGGGASSSAIDMGSAMKIDRLHCRDSVFIRTETRDVSCDQFDYDVRNRFAVIAADPGRFASVTTRGSHSVNTAQRMEWNMLRDSITIVNASGSAPR